jgi:CHAT domain-containing protein
MHAFSSAKMTTIGKLVSTMIIALGLPLVPASPVTAIPANVQTRQEHQSSVLALSNYLEAGSRAISEEKIDEAIANYLRAAEINRNLYGRNDETTLNMERLLAALYTQKQEYSTAEKLLLSVLGNTDKASLAGKSRTAEILDELSTLYGAQLREREALDAKKRSIDIKLKLPGVTKNKIGQDLLRLAQMQQNLSDLSSAERSAMSALEFDKTSPDSPSDTTIEIYSVLGINHLKSGKNTEAEEALKYSIHLAQSLHGRNSQQAIDKLSVLANLYMIRGLYDKAIALLKESERAATLALKPIILNNLGLAYLEKKDWVTAEKYLTESLKQIENRKKSSPHGVQEITDVFPLINLGNLFAEAGRFQEGARYTEKALGMLIEIYGKRHSEVATAMNNLASIHHNTGNYIKAEEYARASKSIQDELFDASHPKNLLTNLNLATLYLDQSKYVESLAVIDEYITNVFRRARREAAGIASADRSSLFDALLDRSSSVGGVLYSAAIKSPDVAKKALEYRINRHGLLQELAANQNRLVRVSLETKTLAEQIKRLHSQLSSGPKASDERAILTGRLEDLETLLYKKLPSSAWKLSTVDNISSRLGKQDALISFQRYKSRIVGVRGRKELRWGPHKYLAFVLKSDGHLDVADLGNADAIDSAIDIALQASQEGYDDAEDKWQQVTSLILAPISSDLVDTRNLFVVPDGSLHRVPFTGLQAIGLQSNLRDIDEVRILTSERDLIYLGHKSVPRYSAPVVIANPAFSRDMSESKIQETRPRGRDNQEKQLGFAPHLTHWVALPGSEQEGELISKKIGGRLIAGTEATENSLKTLKSPKVLHIATHGFFGGALSIGQSQGRTNAQLEAGVSDELTALVQSGIVLTGINDVLPIKATESDGYLSALEITGLNLSDTQLAVISACTTAYGSLVSGDGMYGIQRSLAVAGARSSLLSLWKVDDEATVEFMARFYDRLLLGESRNHALLATQSEFRDGNTRNGIWRHPYYWAAWQLVGDWRPIEDL